MREDADKEACKERSCIITILVHILPTFFQKNVKSHGKKREQVGSDHTRKALRHKGCGEIVAKHGKAQKSEKGMGNNPMVGATVAVAVAVEEAVK